MKFLQVQLVCRNTAEMKRYYTETLEMKLSMERPDSFAVWAGDTRLLFQESPEDPYYHLCFRTDDTYFEKMYAKLEHTLLPNEEGETKLYWEGSQCYFKDPDGNILEMLVRFKERADRGWHDVGEVGLPGENLDELVNELLSGFDNHFQEESDTFRFFGDNDGVFVLGKEGRPWYPLSRPAPILPLKAVVLGGKEGQYQSERYPYRISVRTEWQGELPAVQMRMARPTDKLEKIKEFYEKGLGLKKIGGFSGHNGYEGVMYGLPDQGVHLEFTSHEEGTPCPAPTKDNLLVFYMADRKAMERIAANLEVLGAKEAKPENSYWETDGKTFEDPDGWRVVLMHSPGIL